MGTPDFAVPSLDILHRAGDLAEVVAVVTATDKAGGRGHNQLLESPVKKYAVAHGIPLLQPERLKNKKFLAALRSLEADLFVVVAFRMLPEAVWDMPAIGTVNLHGSLLPRYRGAAPINWAIINGEKETGVSTFFIEKEIDTGMVIMQTRMPIGPDTTAGELHDTMMLIGADTLLETVRRIREGHYDKLPQDDSLSSPAPKIFHDTCQIDFSRPVQQAYDFIRGLSPYPCAWTNVHGAKWKLITVRPIYEAHHYPPGQVITDRKSYLRVTATDGYIDILSLQQEGKKRMEVRDFLNGNVV